MGLTQAQRHNQMMDRVMSEYTRLKKDPDVKSFKKHRVKIGKAAHYPGDQYPGPKASVLKKRTV